MKDVLISVPTRGQIDWATVTRLEEIHCEANLKRPILYEPGAISVALTRNKIVKKFLDSKAEVLMMVDDDIVPPPHALDAIKHFDEDSDIGLICLPHPMPVVSVAGSLGLGVFDKGHDGSYHMAEPQIGLVDCDAVATGCVFIRREVLEKLGRMAFHLPDDPYQEVVGEDFLFCEDLRKAGWSVTYLWDGVWCSDHRHVVGMASVIERQARLRALYMDAVAQVQP